jgi:hypothetical protein
LASAVARVMSKQVSFGGEFVYEWTLQQQNAGRYFDDARGLNDCLFQLYGLYARSFSASFVSCVVTFMGIWREANHASFVQGFR